MCGGVVRWRGVEYEEISLKDLGVYPSLKYSELEFRTEEDRLNAVKYIKEQAEVTLPGTRVVRIGRVIYRVSLHKLKEQYFLIHEPRAKEIELPRIWLITMPGFALCEIPVGKPMRMCNRRVKSLAVYDEELVYVCDYHGSGLRIFTGEFRRQLKLVPEVLCVRYCPHGISVDKWTYECRAFMSFETLEEEKRRSRLYKGMSFLCLEDYWWRAFLRRRREGE